MDILIAHANSVVERLKVLDNDRLQAIVDRPFQPSIGCVWFDLEKMNAKCILALRRNEAEVDDILHS